MNMGAIANIIALHNMGMLPYRATFLIFTGAALLWRPACSGAFIMLRKPHAGGHPRGGAEPCGHAVCDEARLDRPGRGRPRGFLSNCNV